MSHRFLFRRSADELKRRFECIEKHPLLFCGIVLDHVDVDVLTAEGVTDTTAASLQGCALHTAIMHYFSKLKLKNEVFSRFLDSILESALLILHHADNEYSGEDYCSYFCPNEPRYMECSISWIRGILANAFLGNINQDPLQNRKEREGGLNLYSLFRRSGIMGMQKICCLIQYFITSDPRILTPGMVADNGEDNMYDNYMDLSNPRQRKVVFQKISLTDDKFLRVLQKTSGTTPSIPRRDDDVTTDNEESENAAVVATSGLSSNTSPKTEITSDGGDFSSRSFKDRTVVHDGVMEIGTADAFVNFANANFGYGQFTHSCAQEEILQVCCPEMNVGMLFYGLMDDDTVILTHNVRRFSTYSGYMNSFAFNGPCNFNDYKDQTIITMDALFCKQHTDKGNLRDTKKAYIAWKATLDWHRQSHGVQHDVEKQHKPIQISTGQWGCGMFGGIVAHKYLQQVIAAQLVNYGCVDGNAQLFFSSFNNIALKEALDKIQLSGVSPWDGFRGILLDRHSRTFMMRNIDELLANVEEARRSSLKIG